MVNIAGIAEVRSTLGVEDWHGIAYGRRLNLWQKALVGWNSIITMPVDRSVVALTVSGIICKARPQHSGRWIRRADRWGPARIMCYRTDDPKGDVRVIGWKED